MIVYRVSVDDEGSRCDRIVARLLLVSFPTAQKLFRKGCVKVDGIRMRDGSVRVQRDACIEVYARESISDTSRCVESNSDPRELLYSKFDIVCDRDDYLVINKASGIPVQGGSGIKFSVDSLLRQCDYHLVHRLDRDTSGLLVIAKNRASARYLTCLFREHNVMKEYYAIVSGRITGDGCIQNFLCKGADGYVRVSQLGQGAITYYRAIYTDHKHSVLQLRPKTGRTHQLRVHCAEVLSAPIVGDRRYVIPTKIRQSSNTPLHLHASRIVLDGDEIVVSWPKYFHKTCPGMPSFQMTLSVM